MKPISSEHEHKQDIATDINVLGPGDYLRNARLALDIDVSKLADRLHLTTDVVEALERDDYSDLTARVFVRGYLRNYAREVNQSADAVLEKFDQVWPESERPVKVTQPPRLASDSRLGSRWSLFFTWLFILIGVGLFLAWWQGYLDGFLQQQQSETPTESTQFDAAPPPPENANMLPDFIQPKQPRLVVSNTTNSSDDRVNQDTPTQPDATPPLPESAVVSHKPDSETAQFSTSPPTRAATTPPTITEEADVVMSLRPVIPITERSDTPNTTQQSNPPMMPDSEAITMMFSERCWVDIRDSSRTYKLVGEMDKGDRRQLGGRPPYSMIIGNASAARIELGGKPYDLTQHTSGNVARFTLRP